MIISIDPGLNHCGFAVWSSHKNMIFAGLSKNPSIKTIARPERWCAGAGALVRKVMGLPEITDFTQSLAIVIEIPVVRQRGSGKGDPNDLIDVAGVAAACVQAFKNTIGTHVAWAPKPEEWKGQAPKSVTELRVKEKLSDTERKLIEPVNPGVIHNVYDAIHLGLVFLKR